ncbi:Arc-like DNA binding dprotein [Agrobacterium vitis]|nr:Arc-like DNA binding dprotein [Agrobacterium vitis]
MARPKYPSDEIDKTMVRFPAGLMERVKKAAIENKRSMNAEIIHRLENSFALLPELEEDDLQAIIRQIEIVKFNLVKAHSKNKSQSDSEN